MTRFDEALREFASTNEQQMGERVGAFANRYATVQTVGRGRARRTFLIATASAMTVLLVGGAAWAAPRLIHAVMPPAGVPHSAATIQYLGDPATGDGLAFTCWQSLSVPLDEPVLTTLAVDATPQLKQSVVHYDDEGKAVPVVFGADAPTLPSEDLIGISADVAWPGEEPDQWGVSTYGVLVDAGGIVRSVAMHTGTYTAGDVLVEYDGFFAGGCSSQLYEQTGAQVPWDEMALNGEYTLRTVVQVWEGKPSNPVAQWVDWDLPKPATLTFDSGLLEAQAEQQQQNTEDSYNNAVAAFRTADGRVTGADGAALTLIRDVCTRATALADGGLNALPAIPIDAPPLDVELLRNGIRWTTVGADDTWWGDQGQYTVVYVNADGSLAGQAVTQSTQQTIIGAKRQHDARFTNQLDAGCDVAGVPEQSGTYQAYLVMNGTAVGSAQIPGELADAGGLTNTEVWVPLGTYEIP